MFSSKGSSAGVDNKLANGTARDLSPMYYQAAHGFVAGDVVYRKSDGTFAKADCTTGTTSEVAGIVKSVKGTGRFTLAQIGEVDLVAANFTEAALPSTDGATCFLSATAGKLTITEPSTVGYISKPIVVYTSGGKGLFFNMRGSTVGGTNLYTSIGLSNGTATTLQSISSSSFVAGSGGFIEGFIKLAGSSVNTITTFKVEFTKPASGTGYTCTVSYGGEALPSGSSIDITTGGAIQLTLPTISGFTSGTATFAMQASAIGATLPLQIPNSQITWSENPASGNQIINGGIDWNQRGTTVSTDGSYASDRWYLNHNITTAALSRQVATWAVTGFCNRLVVTTKGAGTVTVMAQPFETANVKPLAGKTVTFSCKMVRNSTLSSGNVVMRLVWGTGTDEKYPTGGSVLEQSISTSSIPTSNGTVFSYTATIPSNATSLRAVIGMNDGSWPDGSYIEVSEIMLNLGSAALPFQRAGNTIGGELALCQRYYENGDTIRYTGVAFNSTRLDIVIPFKVTKRTAPAYTVAAVSNLQPGGSSTSAASGTTDVDGLKVNLTSSSLTGGSSYCINASAAWTASSEL